MSQQSPTSEIHKSYTSYIDNADPVPPSLAAVLAVSDAVSKSQQPLTTSSESIALIASLSKELKNCLQPGEALEVSSGTDAFQKQLVTTNARSVGDSSPTSADARRLIIDAAKTFVDRSIAARNSIARYGRRIINDGSTIVVPSYSKLVDDLIEDAVDAGVDFQVIFVNEADFDNLQFQATQSLMKSLRKQGIGVGVINVEKIAQVLRNRPINLIGTNRPYTASQMFVLTGASALLASGGILASLQTQVTCAAAKTYAKHVWVAAETTLCVKELGIKSQASNNGVVSTIEPDQLSEKSNIGKSSAPKTSLAFVSPNMITSFVTEHGPLNACAVAEEALRMWS